MSRYLVTWMIDLEADDLTSPLDAARRALEIQRDPNSIAVVFDVTEDDGDNFVRVDLITDLQGYL